MITAVVITKNEEVNLERCLNSLRWCDELIVIDDFSDDKTIEVAKKFNAKIFTRKLNNDYAFQRNFGLQKAAGEWVFFIDADEEVTEKLQKEIQKALLSKKANGFYLKRTDFLFGKELKHGETARVKLLRLAQKGAGKWQRQVDETWEITGKTEVLKNPLLHYPHPTLTSFLKSINYKSTLNAQVFYEEGKRTRPWDWLKPKAKFFQNWILRLGFLDGMEGLIMALMMSFHSFLVRSKLYLLWKKEGGWGR